MKRLGVPRRAFFAVPTEDHSPRDSRGSQGLASRDMGIVAACLGVLLAGEVDEHAVGVWLDRHAIGQGLRVRRDHLLLSVCEGLKLWGEEE